MNRLPMLRLDHMGAQPMVRGWPALLLGVTTALGAVVAWEAIQLASSAAALQGQVQERDEAAEHAVKRHRPARLAPEDVADERLVWRIRAELALPWDRLFGAIEACASPDVSLLTLTPAPARGELGLSGEARNMAAVLDFLRRLQGSGAFSNVYLRDHHVDAADPQQPVRFSVNLGWGKKP
jgi:hypothetical protein